MSGCGIGGSAEGNASWLQWVCSGELSKGSIWLHGRSWDNRTEVDFAFSGFIENNIDRFPGFYWPTVVPACRGTRICMSVIINMYCCTVRVTSTCHCFNTSAQETESRRQDNAKCLLPLSSVTLLPSGGRRSGEELKRWGREQGKQNFKRQGSKKKKRREQKGQWNQILSERVTAGPNSQHLLQLLVLGKMLQIQ